jgi:hypothetical protein
MSTKLYISFTTIPSRINNIVEVLNSIQKQTLQPDKIIINYPDKLLRLKTISDITKFIQLIENHELYKTNKIYLNKCSDYGPITKLYPLINLNFINNEDMIIIIDDDNEYNKYLFEKLVEQFKKYNCSECITLSGLLYPTIFNDTFKIINNSYNTELIEAAFGFIIKKAFLTGELHKWVINPSITFKELILSKFYNSFMSDDYLFSKYLDKLHIKKRVIDNNNFVTKNNCYIKNDNLISIDSISIPNIGCLNRYYKASFELTNKGLI